MKPSFTPLRYPGGKSWLFEYVSAFLEFHDIHLGTVVEPFAGSASISVGLLKNKLADEAYICEKDPLISSFWDVALTANDELIENVRRLSVSISTWKKFKKYLRPDAVTRFSTMELATAFVFYNRTNYSGILKAGPIGGKRQESKYNIKCRFNKEYVCQKIATLDSLSGKIHVIRGDGIRFIREYSRRSHGEDQFFYIDPPYYDAGKVLYRNYFEVEDHIRLANTLEPLTEPWLLSYDDVDFIHHTYEGTKLQFVYSDRQAGNLRREVRELLLSNKEIPPICADFTQMESVMGEELSNAWQK